jgi:hypothetical protein
MAQLRNKNLREAKSCFSSAASQYRADGDSEGFRRRMTKGLDRLIDAVDEIDTKLDSLMKRN